MATCNQRLLFILYFVLVSLTYTSARKLKLKRDLHNYGSLNSIDHAALKALFGEDGYFSDTRQDTVDPSVLGGIRLQIEASKLSAKLRWISNEELGITHMQAIYDSLPYKNKKTNVKDVIDRITNRLKDRFKGYLQVLRTNKITVQNLYKFHVKQPITKIVGCCNLQFNQLYTHPQYGCKVATQTSCELFPENLKTGAFNPGRNLTEVWRSNIQYFPSLKWQYFISVDGVHSEYPGNTFQWFENCHDANNLRHRNVYVSTVQPQPKHVVIVMDHGNSLSPNQLRTAKGIAKHILASLSEKDRVGVIGLASKVSHPREPDADSCLHNSMVPVTFEASLHFCSFIDKLEKEDAATNHSLGFQTAFDIVQKTMHKSQGVNMDNAMIVYISRGLLSSLAEARDVMETIASMNGRLGNRVIINTYAVIDDGKPVMYEKSFLQTIADQNFAKYDVRERSPEPIVPGTMMAINTTKDLSMSVGQFYTPFHKSASEQPIFSLPYIDQADKALTMSITQTCFHNEEVIGIMGVDLHMEDIVQDVTYYDEMDGSYAFIINAEGYTIMHPSFTRPIKTHIQPMHTDIWHFENNGEFARIRSDMINLESGERTLVLKNEVKTNQSENLSHFYATYVWKRVENTPFIVVIKTLQQIEEARVLQDITGSQDQALLYHRLDLLPASNMCLHLKQLATEDTSTVFLSAKCFNEPYDHLSLTEDKKMVRSYTAYLKESSVLLTNPGIKDGVRDDTSATGRITTEWIRRYINSPLKDNVIRRYIATPSGVFRIYPGVLLDKTFDPSKRTWYNRPFKFPGMVTLTAPYLDVGGAGYITTISHTIFEGKPAALPSPTTDKVVAVMGMDLTLGYFYKLLEDNIYICSHKTVRCFIMDDRGYLIAHPALIEPNGKGPVEKQHITHQEPLVANDILNHRHFVRKKRCNRFNDRTIQRHYSFNTSLDGVLTNLVHGEHCSRYQIVHIPQTNAFLGIVNHTCDTATAFCPCSMLDRLCLNCKQMEQTVCECPCECPLEVNFCTGGLLEEENNSPSCDIEPEEETLLRLDPKLTEEIKPCRKHVCEGRKTKLGCISVMGCQWCQVHKDRLTPIVTPYCADQRMCFGGIEEAQTPYGDENRAMPQSSEPSNTKTTPVGPVAGGIMGCFLVLAMGVYCYRHHIHRSSNQYITNLQDNPNRTSNLYDTDDIDPIDEPGTGHTNFLLATFENPASVSPYRMSTSYRRPAGGDSDHGYSTMTPHEDSEHASLPCSEPFISKDRYRPVSYAITKSHALPPPPSSNSYRRSRSPTPPQTKLTNIYQPIPEQTIIPQQTLIPEINSVIANVQVHMVDTH